MFARSKDCEARAARRANSMRFLAGPVVGQRASIKASTRTGGINEPELFFSDRCRLCFEFWVGCGLLDIPKFLQELSLENPFCERKPDHPVTVSGLQNPSNLIPR